MDHSTVQVIIESHSKQRGTGVTKPKDAKAKRQHRRDSHQKQFLGLRLLGLAQPVTDASLEPGWYWHFAHGIAQPTTDIAPCLCLLCARGAAPEMLDHFKIAFDQQFIVDVRVEFCSKLLARLLAKFRLSHNLFSF